jgi:hypothetical protein
MYKNTHGENAYDFPSKLEFMLAAAKIICEIVYARLAAPAVCPRKLHHPIIHDHIGTCFSGTTCLVTKYIPPAVGYADTSSDTSQASCQLKLSGEGGT